MEAALQQQIESRVEALGYEIVELTQTGSSTRPILQIRIDRLSDAGTPETGKQLISVEDCTRVSRAIEAELDERPDLSERYILEVSSPGIERPLVKPRDFQRFAGEPVAIKTQRPVGELGKRVEGVLQGISENDVVKLDIDGTTVEIERDNIKKANIVFKWDDAAKKKK